MKSSGVFELKSFNSSLDKSGFIGTSILALYLKIVLNGWGRRPVPYLSALPPRLAVEGRRFLGLATVPLSIVNRS